jgi:hypothetical protein
MPRIKLLIVAVLFAAIGITACGGDDDTVTLPPETTKLTFNLHNFKKLEDLNYQIWALVGNYGYSLVRFNVNDNGEFVDTSGTVITDMSYSIDIGRAYISDIGITVEPAHDTLTAPTHYFMGGTPTDGAATLSVDHDAGMAASFAALSGKYVLATPTNGANTDELSGVWFLDNTTGVPVKGLNIPELESGWRYEGWVMVQGTAISTGTFEVSDEADDTLRYGGATAGPNYPGEDFLQNAPSGVTFPLDLSGASVFITLEPWYDPHPESPSPYKILQATVPASAVNLQTYTMDAVAANNLPTGTVTLEPVL